VTDVLNPVDIEQRIRWISDKISEGVKICSEAYSDFLTADRVFDHAYAIAYMQHDGPAHEKRYAADLLAMDQRKARDVSDAAYRYADRTAKALENELRAYQSIGASVREQYKVAGVGER
jgi:hypothetical protein